MKLVVTIPCLNEAKTLPTVIKSVPQKIKGIKKIEILVIDDGSTDQTAQVARKAGTHHLITHRQNLGLARTFSDGIQSAIDLKADIIVNIDGDGQYDASEIPGLIKPIIDKKADMVLGDRQVGSLKHMPLAKKIGNITGSWVIRKLTGTKVQDASTGFRAFTSQTAKSFRLISGHTYTHETIIHAHFKGFKVIELPVKFRKRKAGQSRLIKGVWNHIKTSMAIIVRTILMYKAFKFLTLTGLAIMFLGLIGALRFLWFYLTGEGSGHVQSLILASILISIGFTTLVMGILADLININRKMIEKNH